MQRAAAHLLYRPLTRNRSANKQSVVAHSYNESQGKPPGRRDEAKIIYLVMVLSQRSPTRACIACRLINSMAEGNANRCRSRSARR